MKKQAYFLLLISCFSSGLWGERLVYIVNNSSETVSVKGPVMASNKVAIPETLKPGEMVVKDAERQGGLNDTLVVTLLGHTTQAIQSYSKKYTKPATALIFVDENEPARIGPGFDLWQTDTFSPATVTTPTVF